MNLYTKEDVSGFMTSKIGRSPIFQFIQNLDQDTKGSQKAYIGEGKHVYTKENAKVAVFKYLVEDKGGKEIAAEFGDEKEAKYGAILGNTLIGLRIGLRQKGVMKDVENAKDIISEHVDFIYDNFSL